MRPLYTKFDKFDPILGSVVLTITKITYPISSTSQLIKLPLIATGMVLSIYPPSKIPPKTL